MQIAITSRWVNILLSFRDHDKDDDQSDEPEFITNTEGSFEIVGQALPSDYDEASEFGFRRGGTDG